MMMIRRVKYCNATQFALPTLYQQFGEDPFLVKYGYAPSIKTVPKSHGLISLVWFGMTIGGPLFLSTTLGHDMLISPPFSIRFQSSSKTLHKTLEGAWGKLWPLSQKISQISTGSLQCLVDSLPRRMEADEDQPNISTHVCRMGSPTCTYRCDGQIPTVVWPYP